MTLAPATYIKQPNKRLTKEDKRARIPGSGSFPGDINLTNRSERNATRWNERNLIRGDGPFKIRGELHDNELSKDLINYIGKIRTSSRMINLSNILRRDDRNGLQRELNYNWRKRRR